MLETGLLVSNVAWSGVCACISMDFSWKAAGLEILAVTPSSRNWMCFSGVICGQRVVLFFRSSVSFSWSAPSSPCELMVQARGTCCCSFLPAEKSTWWRSTFHRKSQYGGFYAHTNFLQWHAETFLMSHLSAVMGHQSECPAEQSCAWPKMPACPSVHPNAIMA